MTNSWPTYFVGDKKVFEKIEKIGKHSTSSLNIYKYISKIYFQNIECFDSYVRWYMAKKVNKFLKNKKGIYIYIYIYLHFLFLKN